MRKVFLENLPKTKKTIKWKECIGKNVNFIYDDINDTLKIIGYKIKNKMPHLIIKYNNCKNDISINNFKKAELGKIIGKISFCYKYNIGDVITDIHSGKIKILQQIKIQNSIKDQSKCRGYKYKCLICGNIDTISESNLNKKTGCNVCCNNPQKVIKGINDVATTNPKLGRLFVYLNDSYKYTEHSDNQSKFKCPNCGNIINKKISDVNRRGLSCPKCSDGISYPEKLMYNILKQLNVDFIYQLTKTTFKWCDKYKYDFYFKINNKAYIIETHGGQHYIENSSFNKSLQEEQKNDDKKLKLAVNNNIKKENYIIIDCRKSELEFIKNNILKSELNKIFNFSKIDWNECERFLYSSFIKIACDLWNSGIKNTKNIGQIMHLNSNTICRYLKQGKKLMLNDYESKTVMNDVYKQLAINNRKKVICLNNKKIFNSIQEAKQYSNLKSSSGIILCCRGKRNYAGRDLLTKEYLKWKYYDDFLNNIKLYI